MTARMNLEKPPVMPERSLVQRLVGIAERGLFQNRPLVLVFFVIASLFARLQGAGVAPGTPASRG